MKYFLKGILVTLTIPISIILGIISIVQILGNCPEYGTVFNKFNEWVDKLWFQ